MNNKKFLSVLGLVLTSGLAQGALAQAQTEAGSEEAAKVVQELVESGYLKVDESSGRLTLKKSVLDLLKEAGIAKEGSHSDLSASSCNSTVGGGGCSSPF